MTDMMVFAAHPDDAELGCGGTIAKSIAEGKKVMVVDLTRGELGSRGTPEERAEETRHAATVLGLADRLNLGLEDGGITASEENIRAVVAVLRKYQPTTVIATAERDRHPDHGAAAELIERAWFFCGVHKFGAGEPNQTNPVFRPNIVLHYIQDRWIQPDIIVDVSAYWEKKIEAIKAHKSQFHQPGSTGVETYISSPHFLDTIQARAVELGKIIGAPYAEGFTCRRPIGLDNLSAVR